MSGHSWWGHPLIRGAWHCSRCGAVVTRKLCPGPDAKVRPAEVRPAELSGLLHPAEAVTCDEALALGVLRS